MRRLLHRPPTPAMAEGLLRKYNHAGDLEAAAPRVLELIRFFDEILERQERRAVANGASDAPVYLVGNELSAADVYWAVGAGMLVMHPAQELVAPDEENAYNAAWRTSRQFVRGFQATNQPFEAAITERLRAHQDMVIRSHCKYPLK